MTPDSSVQITDSLQNSKRILYKISGESLMGEAQYGYDVNFMKNIAHDIKNVIQKGLQLCLVIGGGNIYRGVYGERIGMDRSVADYMGMLATIMNGIALQNIMTKNNIDTRVMSAIPIPQICEPYIHRKAMRHLEKGRVVIFVAGIGNPFFTTDTTAILRAMEVQCDFMVKGTGVDGIYTDDPRKNPDIKRYNTIQYQTLIEKNLKIMDMSAISLARDKQTPIIVFSIKQATPLTKLIENQTPFTLVSSNHPDTLS